MLSRNEIIEKLTALPDLPVVFMSRFGQFGEVNSIQLSTMRRCQDGQYSLINDEAIARREYANTIIYRQNWLNGKDEQVILITD